MPEPICQASIIRYTTTDSHGTSRVLFSNPASTNARENMTVKLSYDNGHSYTHSRTIYAGSSAYSDLVIQSDNLIGLLYERDHYGKINYAQFNLEWLTQGADSLSDGPAPTAYLLNEPFDDLSGWSTSGSGTTQISPAGQLHILDTSNAVTNVFRSDISVPSNYTIEFKAKVTSFTGSEVLGIKVQDGAKRLMFRREADGMYALTSSGQWEKVKATSTMHEWVDYKIAVNNGVATLYSKISANQSWKNEATWQLQNRTDPDRVEIWGKGAPAAPSEFHVDYIRKY